MMQRAIGVALLLFQGAARRTEALACSGLVVGVLGASVAAAQAPETGQLVVTTNDADCAISVDEREVGSGSVVVPDLLPGGHIVRVRCSDGRTAQQVANVAAGQSAVVEVAVDPAASPSAPPEAPPPSESPPAPQPAPDVAAPAASSMGPIDAELGPAPPPADGWSGGPGSSAGSRAVTVGLVVAAVGGVAALVGIASGDELAAGIAGALGGATVVAGLAVVLIGLAEGSGGGPPEESGSVYAIRGSRPLGLTVSGAF